MIRRLPLVLSTDLILMYRLRAGVVWFGTTPLLCCALLLQSLTACYCTLNVHRARAFWGVTTSLAGLVHVKPSPVVVMPVLAVIGARHATGLAAQLHMVLFMHVTVLEEAGRGCKSVRHREISAIEIAFMHAGEHMPDALELTVKITFQTRTQS